MNNKKGIICNWISGVEDFNKAFHIQAPTTDGQQLRLQYELVMEEINELKHWYEELDDCTDGGFLFNRVPSNKELKKKLFERAETARVEVLDAIIDSIYTLIGLGLKLDFDLDGAFDEVQRSNMSKFDEDGKPIYHLNGKVAKGKNYFKPNLKQFVDKSLKETD